jgi:tRNA-binding protein
MVGRRQGRRRQACDSRGEEQARSDLCEDVHGVPLQWRVENHPTPQLAGAQSVRRHDYVGAVRERPYIPYMATIDDFHALDIRVGTVVEAHSFPEARKPAFKLVIDFGPEVGHKRSSAQLTKHYTPEALLGRQVIGVVNFPPRRIAGFESEVLVLGAMPTSDDVILLAVDLPVENGARIG